MHGSAPAASRVALITTVLNEAASLPALLDSIDAQTRPPDELIAVDGGSTDGTLDALHAWAESRSWVRVISAPGATIARGRNLAIAATRAPIIAATDAGVRLDPRWLEHLARALDCDPDADVASGFFVSAPETGFERALGATTLPMTADISPSTFLPSSRSVAFRRSAWEAVGGYPEWLDYGEDLVFDLALQRKGLRFVWVPEAIVSFRPRRTLPAFVRQYFLYARGDGKADLWRGRHALRYATYLLGLPCLWRARRHPPARFALLVAAALYVRRPLLRLLATPGAPCTPGSTLLEIAALPFLRFAGDAAKMVGYPVGFIWRLRHRARMAS